jgi:hypothetical protein
VWGFGTGSSSQYRHEGSRNDDSPIGTSNIVNRVGKKRKR